MAWKSAAEVVAEGEEDQAFVTPLKGEVEKSAAFEFPEGKDLLDQPIDGFPR